MVNHKYFCSLLVGKDQDILYEKYANDFTEKTPQNNNVNYKNICKFICW